MNNLKYRTNIGLFLKKDNKLMIAEVKAFKKMV